jgi:hypothetical protein
VRRADAKILCLPVRFISKIITTLGKRMLHSGLAQTFWVVLLVLALLRGGVRNASAQDLPHECVPAETLPGSPTGYFHFEYIARHITVGGCIETEDGRKFGARFILDTGSEQTSLNPTLVEFARLQPVDGEKNFLTVTGVRPTRQVKLPALLLNGRQIRDLTTTVDERLVHASQEFSTNFGVVVGLDVLSRYVVSIDYPYRRVAFFDKAARVNRSSEVARFPFEVRHGQMIVHAILPNGAQVSLEFDTGLGMDADVMLYQDATEGVRLLPPLYSLPLEEGVEVRVGHLPWIDFERIHVESPTIALNPSKVPDVFGERHSPGLLGPLLFEDYTVEIDFHNHLVRVLRTKPRFQQAVPKRIPAH